MAILTVLRPVAGGATSALVAAAAGGDSFPNTGVEFFEVLNSHATLARTVTFDSPGTCNCGLAASASHDGVVVVPGVSSAPANRVVIGPFSKVRFNDGNERVQVSYSDAAADLTVGVRAPA